MILILFFGLRNKDKKDISSNFDSKADLYSLNNSILEII